MNLKIKNDKNTGAPITAFKKGDLLRESPIIFFESGSIFIKTSGEDEWGILQLNGDRAGELYKSDKATFLPVEVELA